MVAFDESDWEEPDWEERMWSLTHDLVVTVLADDHEALVTPRDLVADCVVVASTTVAMFRAVMARYPGGMQ